MSHNVAATPEQLFERVDTYLDLDDRLKVREALEFARQKHGNQFRKSGRLFYIHPLTVAYYLAEFHLDVQTLVATLLHDVAEDASVPIEEIAARFGEEVAVLVGGVTKLKDVSVGLSQRRQLSRQEIQDISTQKLFRQMATDVRVVIIKLFDRLHNMRTIKYMSDEGQQRKARETLYVFAPMANRLGIWDLKSELEALSLEVLNNRDYRIVKKNLKRIREEQQNMYRLVSGQIFGQLLEANLDVRKVELQPENIYTVYRDLKSSGLAFNEVSRTLRLVVLFDDWISCYTALGHLHQLWQVVPDRFDDYISVPRDNLYRSLHTTVIHSSGQNIKIRLRTEAMDKVSQIGVLARWRYAGTPLWEKGVAERIEALSDNIGEIIATDYQDPGAAVKMVVEDVFAEQVRIYTPRGDAIELAQGATPIDFAYMIHTGIGDQCQEAYVNDILSPLNRPLRNGDQVQIVKGERTEPQREWLDEDLGYLRTNYARHHARRWFRRLSEEKADDQGQDLLQAELRMLGLPRHSHQAIARSFGYQSTKELYHQIGRAELLPTVVATRVLDEKWAEEPVHSLDNVVIGPSGEKYIISKAGGRHLRLCATCEPRPRDNIVGYLRKNGEVTVHKEGCHSLRTNRAPGRLLKLGWGAATARKARLITIQVDVYDRSGLLFDITQLMQEEEINIPFICTVPTPHVGDVRLIFNLEVERPRQAVRILHQVRALVNVYRVRCLPQGYLSDYEGSATPFYKPE